MNIENIVFENEDSLAVTATKTVMLSAGSSELKPQLKRLGVDYVKVERGLHTYYILKSKTFTKLKIKL